MHLSLQVMMVDRFDYYHNYQVIYSAIKVVEIRPLFKNYSFKKAILLLI